MSIVTVTLNTRQFAQLAKQLAAGLDDASSLMAGIAQELLDQTETNFANQAGPTGGWAKLSETTLALRAKRGKTGRRKLQDGGDLAASVQTSHDKNTASVSSNKVYAAMQQFGGTTSLKSMIPGRAIPARPFLPFAGTPENPVLMRRTEIALTLLVRDYVQGLARKR